MTNNEILARLAPLAERHVDPSLTSIYLDLDGRTRPAAEQVADAFASLAAQALHTAEAAGPEVLAATAADLALVRARVASGFDRHVHRGVALFASGAEGWLEEVPLGVAVRDQVVVGAQPYLRPLHQALESQRGWLVVLADREHARLLRFEAGELIELASWSDPAPPRVDVSVRSGPHAERHVDELMHRHLTTVAKAVSEHLSDPHSPRVVVGGPEKPVAELAKLLAKPNGNGGTAVAGRLSVAVLAGREQLRERMVELVDEIEADDEAKLIAGLGERVLAVGLDDVLLALTDRRVASLVVERSFSGGAVICGSCGFAAAVGAICPRCQESAVPLADGAEWAIEQAILQRAEVHLVAPGALGAYSGIVAVERF